MKISETEIPDVVIIEPNIIKDERGFFMEVYKEEWFINSGIPFDFVQENHSLSIQNTLRGLHYQVSHIQGKLVRAIAGVIYNVPIDLRRKSKFFGKSVVRVLSDENKHLLWIPPGFAHGFYVISRSAEVVYKATDYYDLEGERQIR